MKTDAYLIHHFLEHSADLFPDREAVVHGNRRFSYADIEQASNRIARWLISERVRKGDRIALLHRNSVDYIAAYYGILKAGGVAVPLNTGLPPDEISGMIHDSGASVIMTETHFSKIADNISADRSIPCRIIVFSDSKPFDGSRRIQIVRAPEILSSYPAHRPDVTMIDQDISSIVYTSGSTGKPKGVMLTHLNTVANTKSIIAYLELTGQDRCMAILPFYYVYGKSLLNTHMAVGGTVIIDNRFTFPNAVLKTMAEENATGFAGVPSTYSILLNRSGIAKMSFPALRYLTQAGGGMASETRKRLMSLFPDKQIYIMYGATEASARLSYLDPGDLPKKIRSVGKAIPNAELAIFREDGTPAACGEEGEIAARGSNIMIGYWNDPAETAKALKNGWYFTGDTGYRDEDGFFFHTGRKRDMIKVGVFKVSAMEIEEILYRHPAVQDAAVIAVPSELMGEVPAAVVLPKPGETPVPEDLIRFCSGHLPEYKTPKQMRIVDHLPKNEAGKILKRKLAALFSDHDSHD